MCLKLHATLNLFQGLKIYEMLKRVQHDAKFSICLFAFVATSLFSNAQTLTFPEVDKTSYRLYTEQKWDSLIDYVRTANKAGIDYYYLQARLAAAFYEKKKYRSAAFAYQKVLKQNSADSYARHSLYYSLLNSGNTTASRYLSGKYESIKNATDSLGYNKLGFAYLEGGVKLSSMSDSLGNMSYFNLGLRHSAGRRFSFYHAFSYLDQMKRSLQIRQYGYYLGAWIQLGMNWKVCPSLHLFRVDVSGGIPGQDGPIPVNSQINEQVVSLVVQRSFSLFDLGGMVSYNNFDSIDAGQFGGYLSLYPFGSNTFSATTTVVYHTRKTSDYQTIIKETVNAKLHKYLWVTGEFAYGNEQVMLQPEAGFPANNSVDPNNYRFSLLLTSPVSKTISLYGFYQHEDKEETITDPANISRITNYKFNSLILGLKIKL